MATPHDPRAQLLAVMSQQLDRLDVVSEEAELIEQLGIGETLLGMAEAWLAHTAQTLDARRRAAEAHQGVTKAERGKGLGAEIALARRETPSRGTQQLELAKTLQHDMPHAQAALGAGKIREEHANSVVKATSWLSPQHKREVDAALKDRFGTASPRQLSTEAAAHAQRLDPKAIAKRAKAARDTRHITTRPVGDGAAQLVAKGPAQEIAALEQALGTEAKSILATGTGKTKDGEKRSRSQIMFDVLVERTTGQPTAQTVPVEVVLVMHPTTLLAHGDTPAWLAGHGPIPAAAAREWLADPEVAVKLRRIFTNPTATELVGFESSARSFPAVLRKIVLVRDNTCRTPFCEAPIQDIDHTVPHRQGGATTWENSSGLCAACNQTKENRGWRHTGDATHLNITTPTGHTYSTQQTPFVPGSPPEKLGVFADDAHQVPKIQDRTCSLRQHRRHVTASTQKIPEHN